MAEKQENMNKTVGQGAKIFSGLSAWFSSSVRPKTTGLWVALGGITHPVEIADYLFSSDVTSPDTAKIFSSSIYEKVAIVHASYIHACILAEDIMKIPLGCYILYPKAFQEK
ncbi:telomere repeats-binding bouquet formation protein 2-like isoform X1 [Octopus bimaculoides]|uniref:telomere repeats-binding bouquet formation protein 2-like isoform X1 n=1 Tax=Octopus bimaculoides TaxID=37653 RepID=UPI0022E68A3F|nr:telomere repeats-binding bouquet formation protein 2-like isoform X1 [Octopus bimaculoides]XP_052829158.1 telomere repeats-binding bouquet formation protein 2-like isoform X1 [Octopus bimaculoides]XP_052829159.1 telomere repeats-binding bouquet formation protein 2-like isoform X1 [Octopus bimaculoides]